MDGIRYSFSRELKTNFVYHVKVLRSDYSDVVNHVFSGDYNTPSFRYVHDKISWIKKATDAELYEFTKALLHEFTN